MVFPPRRAPPHAALVAGARRAAPELDDKDGAAAARDAAHRVGLVRREDEHVACQDRRRGASLTTLGTRLPSCFFPPLHL